MPQIDVVMTGVVEHVISRHAVVPVLDSQVPQPLEHGGRLSSTRRRGTGAAFGFRVRVRRRSIVLDITELPMVCVIVKMEEAHSIELCFRFRLACAYNKKSKELI
jgi:hypothetical protein